ncbi:MAG: hypothetical protein ACO3EH_00410 [Ilumatobacteraceae bacterium]
MAKTKITPNAEEPVSTALSTTQPEGTVDLSAYNPDQYDDVSRDVSIPVLGLVHGIGPLAKVYRNKGGNFALGESALLGEQVQVVPVTILKYFRETHRNGFEIKYGSPEDRTRRKFATAQAAAKAGYAIDYHNSLPHRIEEAGLVGYLVVGPEGDTSGEFALKKGTFAFAQAKCSYQRGGFKAVWRRIFDHAHKRAMAQGLDIKGLDHGEIFNAAGGWSHVWTLTAELVEGNQNSWWEPRIAKSAELPAEVQQWIGQNYGSTTLQ